MYLRGKDHMKLVVADLRESPGGLGGSGTPTFFLSQSEAHGAEENCFRGQPPSYLGA